MWCASGQQRWPVQEVDPLVAQLVLRPGRREIEEVVEREPRDPAQRSCAAISCGLVDDRLADAGNIILDREMVSVGRQIGMQIHDVGEIIAVAEHFVEAVEHGLLVSVERFPESGRVVRRHLQIDDVWRAAHVGRR